MRTYYLFHNELKRQQKELIESMLYNAIWIYLLLFFLIVCFMFVVVVLSFSEWMWVKPEW
jgi:hypothetical protein